MQLTRLEIKGFKSFADKVTINFDEGITGIVGPNGCGKSNVVDSIRWVLGEQKSRVLRSEKMENIIFNGTKNRKQTQLAEVSLTFNNTKNLIPTEYSQVTITRRYYRSGESEYLLNGVACRLKDITNLFLDTGIASNSYAIIELKMVDDLLNDKDNSRRSLFEEAAGISKFKIRKKETLKKLNDTADDLDRVEDLLYEVEKNLRSLERQAKQAKKYYEVKETYKEESIRLAHVTVKSLNEIAERIKDEITGENDKKLSLSKQLGTEEAALQQSKTDQLSKEKLLASRQKTLNDHVLKIRQYESDKKIRNERQRFLQDKIENLKQQISQDKQSNERALFSIESLQTEKETASKILEEIGRKKDILQADHEEQKVKTRNLQEQLQENTASFNSLRDELYQKKKSIEIKQVQLDAIKKEREQSSFDSEEQSASLQQFENKLAEIEVEREEKKEAFEKLKTQEEEIKEKLQGLQEKLEQERSEQAQTNRSLDAKQNEYNLTKSLVENLEGFPEAIKFLKKNKNYKDTPLLSDIIGCPEEYRVCIENYLEPFMNYYLVDSYQDAMEAVGILSNSSQGRAQFFVLSQLDQYQSTRAEGVDELKPAMDIVEYDDKYKHLISYLLDNVWVYEGELPANLDPQLTLIEKSGKLAKRTYSLGGGSVGLFEGKRIGRAKNLEKLEKEIKVLQEKKEKAKIKIESLDQATSELSSQSDADKLEESRDQLSALNEAYVSLKTKQEQFAELLSSNSSKQENLDAQIKELELDLADTGPAIELQEEEVTQLESKVHSFRQEVESFNELLAQKSTLFNEENVLFHQQQNKVSSISQEIDFKQESFESSKQRIERNQEELDASKQDLDELVKKTNINDEDLVAMYDEKESIEAGVNEAEKEYYEVRGKIDTSEKEIREIMRKRETVDQVLMQWQSKENETKLQLTSVKDRLSVEFNIDFESIKDEEQPEESRSESELREIVEKLKNRLENMGPINPMAMEAYEEIKERHDFITGQKEDLLQAKESLLETIAEIDTVAKETFLQAFEEIKANFIKVFRTLFTEEDDCDLKLTDPDNPLESTIDIVAKPKGKRPLTINQLSGGEKTLTATSLLFSIYLIKPAPFCIFDEVDAPLDDANIDKFNNIIRKFSEESQFIIVTHNKRTMASTDIIYGVTMIEQGISRVVPVDLRELA